MSRLDLEGGSPAICSIPSCSLTSQGHKNVADSPTASPGVKLLLANPVVWDPMPTVLTEAGPAGESPLTQDDPSFSRDTRGFELGAARKAVRQFLSGRSSQMICAVVAASSMRKAEIVRRR